MVEEKPKKMKIRRELLGIPRHLRRLFYLRFRKKYVEEQLRKRKGTCLNHGCCATMVLPCKHFDKKKMKCILWKEKGHKAIHPVCLAYPFDERDKTSFAKKHCAFYWDD